MPNKKITKEKIIEAVNLRNNDGLTTKEIASKIGLVEKSLQVLFSSLRKKGVEIKRPKKKTSEISGAVEELLKKQNNK